MLGKKPFPTEDVVEILSDYGVTFVPSASNIEKILLQVSQTELISKPFLYITKLREGMGPFWDDVTDTEFHGLYSVCAPPLQTFYKVWSLMFKINKNPEFQGGSHITSRATTSSYWVGFSGFALEVMCCSLTTWSKSSLWIWAIQQCNPKLRPASIFSCCRKTTAHWLI